VVKKTKGVNDSQPIGKEGRQVLGGARGKLVWSMTGSRNTMTRKGTCLPILTIGITITKERVKTVAESRGKERKKVLVPYKERGVKKVVKSVGAGETGKKKKKAGLRVRAKSGGT